MPRINEEIRRRSHAGALVVYTQDWHPPSTPHFAKDGGIWPVHCVAGTWGAELHPGLLRRRRPSVRKGSQRRGRLLRLHDARPDDRRGACPPSSRRCSDRERGERVVVCGLATDYCVRATALDAARLGFETTRARRCDRGGRACSPATVERAMAEMAAAGVALGQVD